MPVSHYSLKTTSSEPSRVLVIETLYLGDLIHTLPLIQALRSRYPAARLDVLVRAQHLPLMRRISGVNRVLPMVPHQHRSLSGLLRLSGQLRAEKYDLVVNPGASDRATLLTALSGGRVRLGRLNRNGSKLLWPLLHDRVMHQAWGAEPMWWQKLLAFQQVLQLKDEVRFGMDFSTVEFPLPDLQEGFLHISPFASEDIRSLPPATLVELVGSLRQTMPELQIVVSCGPSLRETTRLRAVIPALQAAGVRICCGNLNLDQLGVVLQRAAIHIGPDSGPLHIAAALGTPSAGCFLYKDASAEWLPVGLQHRVYGVATRLQGGLYGLPLEQIVSFAREVIWRRH